MFKLRFINANSCAALILLISLPTRSSELEGIDNLRQQLKEYEYKLPLKDIESPLPVDNVQIISTIDRAGALFQLRDIKIDGLRGTRIITSHILEPAESTDPIQIFIVIKLRSSLTKGTYKSEQFVDNKYIQELGNFTIKSENNYCLLFIGLKKAEKAYDLVDSYQTCYERSFKVNLFPTANKDKNDVPLELSGHYARLFSEHLNDVVANKTASYIIDLFPEICHTTVF